MHALVLALQDYARLDLYAFASYAQDAAFENPPIAPLIIIRPQASLQARRARDEFLDRYSNLSVKETISRSQINGPDRQPKDANEMKERGWNCPCCTLENEAIASTCEACGAAFAPRAEPDYFLESQPTQNSRPLYPQPTAPPLIYGETIQDQSSTGYVPNHTTPVVSNEIVATNIHESHGSVSWSCPQCTLINGDSRNTCMTCAAPRFSYVAGTPYREAWGEAPSAPAATGNGSYPADTESSQAHNQ